MTTESKIGPKKDEIEKQIIEFCRHIAGQLKIASIALVDNYPTKESNNRTVYEVMLIIKNFQPKIMSYVKSIKNKTVFFFALDQWIFDRDIDKGLIGEALAFKLLFPYKALFGGDYLHKKEVSLKRRLILESLENIIINFPELAQTIKIRPQYFLYETIHNRIRVFPLSIYNLASFTRQLIENEKEALGNYMVALKQLEGQEKIIIQNDYVSITKKFIDQSKDPKLRIINQVKKVPRTIFSALFGIFPQLISIASQNIENFLHTQKINWITQINSSLNFIDPLEFVFLPTSKGLISLSDKIDIKGFTKKMLLGNKDTDIKVESIGSMLNDVYLIKSNETKILAKRFKDWSGLKWFPLTIWSFGARSFSVAGQARLAKECAISELLRKKGFNVPKILHVSNKERIVFMEFIEGKSLNEIIKDYSNTTNKIIVTEVLTSVGKVGETFANIHKQKISLGDTKPDNVIVKPEGTIFLIDFEQAQRGGDKAWDIAVFLYYCGHYLQPFENNDKAEAITKAFIDGYLRGKGKIDDIHKAGLPKYTRIFSIFTMPSIILAISNICKKTKKTIDR